MRLVVVHNRYSGRLPSGENRVVDEEIAALRRYGFEVETLIRRSDEIATMGATARLSAFASPITGMASRHDFNDLIDRFRPDVVHLHNPYPLISPRVIDWSHAHGVPVVATIHNFRLRCSNGLFSRENRVCMDCADGRVLPGVIHGCYRDSRLQSAEMAVALRLHRNRWHGVDTFIAVSDFVAEQLLSWGFDKRAIVVKPNAVADPGPPTAPRDGFIYAGRLSATKGVALLLEAWEMSGLDGRAPLLIAGDGPLRSLVEKAANQSKSVQYLGTLRPAELLEARLRTGVGLQTSTGLETHGAAPESYVLGRGVVAVDNGTLGHIVDDSVGWICSPTAASLANALQMASDPAERTLKGRRARARFEAVYDERVVVPQLADLYSRLLS